ncbi:MAG: iron-sulfur cluster assembly accessory protein [Thermoanaerobaculia bacterium]|nr:iron-sulfur cluster assembly accessory protein [Thermoanaerobaculia bacterium]
MEVDNLPASPASAPEAPPVPVTITAKAAQMVKITREQEGIDPDFGLRIAVRGGGCSGFEYALDFENEERPTDTVYFQGDLKVMVDPISARYLAGTEIDYVLGHSGAGFKFNNPNAVGTCGCGSSFSV